jgi:LPXTG-motif cell wall-anchored protein
MNKRKVLVSLLATGLIFGCTLPATASINVIQGFDTEGALNSDWVTSGTTTPSVVRNAGDTPELALRLTPADNSQSGFVLYDQPFNLSQGLKVDFKQYQWGGGGADGIVFFMKKASDTNNVPGAAGGAMGYTGVNDDNGIVNGLSGALLGVGLDAWGNHSNHGYQTGDCNSDFVGAGQNQIVVRGPGQGLLGYCMLANGYGLSANGKKLLSDGYTSRQASEVAVRVELESPFIENPRVKVFYQNDLVVDVPLPAEFKDIYDVKFGFSAGTGMVSDNHEIAGLKVTTLDPEVIFRDLAHPDGLANTGGSLSDYYLLIGAAMALFGGGITLYRKGSRKEG